MIFTVHLPGERWEQLAAPVVVPCWTCPRTPWRVEVGDVGGRRVVRLAGGGLLGRQVATLRADAPALAGVDVYLAMPRLLRRGLSLPPNNECAALAAALNAARAS